MAGDATVPAGATLNPGDQAPPGTPGTGENVRPTCNGAKTLDAKPCPTCGGTGIVMEGVVRLSRLNRQCVRGTAHARSTFIAQSLRHWHKLLVDRP